MSLTEKTPYHGKLHDGSKTLIVLSNSNGDEHSTSSEEADL